MNVPINLFKFVILLGVCLCVYMCVMFVCVCVHMHVSNYVCTYLSINQSIEQERGDNVYLDDSYLLIHVCLKIIDPNYFYLCSRKCTDLDLMNIVQTFKIIYIYIIIIMSCHQKGFP